MKSPMMKTALMIAATFLMAACANDSGSSGGNGGGNTAANQPAPSTKLGLKSTGSDTVIIGAKRDLRKYLVNFDSAEFKVIQGQALVTWADAEQPILAFHKAGKIVVRVTDSNDQTQVDLKFKVTFDSTGIVTGPDIEHPPIGPIHAPVNL